MFNERGLEAVGVREISRELGMSPGNISYYFPSKNDLIIEIYREFVEKTLTFFGEFGRKSDLHPKDLLTLLARVMEIQEDFRCLFLSFNDLTEIAALEKEVYLNEKRWKKLIGRLMRQWREQGLVYTHAGDEESTFFELIKLILIYRFTDSKIHRRKGSSESSTTAYRRRLASVFRLYFKEKPR